MRIGQGFDVHALVAGRKLIVGGVEIPHEKGLAGHSDADVLLHAMCDALLGAAALGDIGTHFPDTDARYKGADSRRLLREVAGLLERSGWRVVNVDATIIAQAPKMAPHIDAHAREHRRRSRHRGGRCQRQGQDRGETRFRRARRRHRGGSDRAHHMDQARQDEGLASPPLPADGTARLFFALWLDAAPRAALGRLAQKLQPQCGGRAVPNRNIHLTLVFLGDVEAGRIPDLCALAEKIVAPGFELAIDTVNYWRHNRIVWAAPQECPAALQALVAGLERALKGGGVRFDQRPYLPHITLLRAARHAPTMQTVDAIRWRVVDFVLVQSLSYDRTTAYEVMQRWPLGAV